MSRIYISIVFHFIFAITSASGCFADSGSVHTNDTVNPCVMNFPTNDTLGLLMLTHAGSRYPNWEEQLLATGPIEIPAGYVAGLEIRERVGNALYVLQSLDVSRLAHLSITGLVNSDSDFKPIEGLKNLRSIDITVSGITDNALAHVARLPDLTALYMRCGKPVDGSGLSYFQNGSSLKSLWIEVGPGSSVRYIPRIESLTSLVVNGHLDSLLLCQLEAQTQLDTLDLERVRLTSEVASRLRTALPETFVKSFYTVDDEPELLDRFEGVWRTLLERTSGFPSGYFEDHIHVIQTRIRKWSEGFSFEVSFDVHIDWLKTTAHHKFLIRRSESEPYLDIETIESRLGSAYFEIPRMNPVFQLRYSNEDEALAEAKRLSGRHDIRVRSYTFHVPGKLPRQDGDPYLLFTGPVPEREYWCVKGWLNLVTGEGNSRESYCGPVE